MNTIEVRYTDYLRNTYYDERREFLGIGSVMDRMRKQTNLVDVDFELLEKLNKKMGRSLNFMGYHAFFETPQKTEIRTMFLRAHTQPLGKRTSNGKEFVPGELRFEGPGIGLVMHDNKYKMARLSVLSGVSSVGAKRANAKINANIHQNKVADMDDSLAALLQEFNNT